MRPHILIGFLFLLPVTSCNNEISSSKESREILKDNMLSELSSDNPGDFEWTNEPDSYTIDDGLLELIATNGSDYFVNPEDNKSTSTAPFIYKEVKGDFVAKALVQPDFSSMWNAVALMVNIDDSNWIKFAFENSNATGPGIVTVVTKNVSDDANGVILNKEDQVWLKVIRKDDIYSMLWSLNGENFKMARLTAMPAAEYVKIGIEAQCPVGKSATHFVEYFGLKETTVKDLRKGE